ncbi:MAG TPA: GAF domain-containing protein [Xanthobacteraceae bacterium]|nr:GAF domain-containing protein [Xanthobacteraceae bacterium]
MLKLISSSFGDPQPVFASILASAVRICDADNGVISRWDGNALHLVATHNMPQAFIELREQSPYRPLRHSPSGRMLATGMLVHIADLAADPAYLEGDAPPVAAVEIGGIRTMLAVPLLKDSKLMGSLSIGRKEVRPFADEQIEIVQNFATQAIVAIQNAQLLHELRQTLQEQSAAADVLKIISRSAFNLQAVLDTVVELAARLCDADLAAVYANPGYFRAFATYGFPTSHREVASNVVFEPGRGTIVGRVALEAKPVQVADVLGDPEYTLHEAQQRVGYRTVLAVPLLRESHPIGAISLMRVTVRPFTDKQIELAQNFADQAVIAIENTRLIAELRQRTEELGRSLADLQRERDNKLMNLEAMAASIAHEVRQPLSAIATSGNAALRFLGRTPPDHKEVRSSLSRIITNSHRASQVFDNIRTLFGKVDKGHELIDMNEIVLEVLHTLRGELKDRVITVRTELTSQLPLVMGHRGQLHEVLLNLVRNAIEAMAAIKDGRRVLQARTERHDGRDEIVVAIEDSGPGIDPEKLDGIFDAFVSTKPQGMGLGLAICRMIIDRHGGQLSASSGKRRGAVFQFILPRQSVDSDAARSE